MKCFGFGATLGRAVISLAFVSLACSSGGSTSKSANGGAGGAAGAGASSGAPSSAGATSSAGNGNGGATGSGGATDTGGSSGNGSGNAGAGGGSAGAAGTTGAAGAAGAPNNCVDRCVENVNQCNGALLQRCVRQASGCTDWATPEQCANGKACNAGACPACTDVCTYGATQCNGSQVQQCVAQTTGCYGWTTPADCPQGKTCTAGVCPVCVDKCTVNATQCNGAQIQTCTVQSSGCTDWEAPTNCDNGKACNGGVCPTCTDTCSLSSTQCSGSNVQTCVTQSNGCADWNTAVACGNGKACVNGGCPTCTDACTLNGTRCNNTQVETCSVQSNGCTNWGTATDCPNSGVCQGSACVAACTVNDLRCNGTLLEVCNGSHQWMTQQVCTQSCDSTKKQCTNTTTCAPNSRRCSGLQSQVCNSTGTAWLNVESCLVSCDNTSGLCTGACTSGAKRCNADTPQTCNSTGTAWTSDTTCATACYNGTCAQPSLTVDADANKTLDGELVFTGDVVIKNSSVVTSNTGKLIIRAKNVIIDASSKIVIAPTGNDPRGRGRDSAQGSCYNASVGTIYATPGASGGGYGATGVSADATATACYTYCYSCTVSNPGGALYGIADDEIVVGSQGGTCSSTAGALGGGYLAIFAETIQIAGQVTANGANATGCAGGGSGGLVYLRATKDLTFTGSISAAGGVGGTTYPAGSTGGNGVVKLLYGDSKTLTGSIVGAQFASYMPPNDLSSATHPRQDRWYNDSYSSFDVAWSKPFIASAGYYKGQNTTYAFVPSSSNATYQSGETITFPAAQLTTGPNYLHVSTLGPFATIGTVESRYVVNINSTTPTISSSSHPTQGTWYANDSPYLSWTLPRPDVNTTNFYWVFDRFKETTPTTSDNKIPMDLVTPQNSKQLLLPGKADGIWFFHLITQDTMGYLTKSAALFQVNVGTDPGKGSVSGTVTAGSGGFLTGVQISLNRGVYTTTTNSSGQFAFTNIVSAQSYEIRARLTGYQDATQTITVTSAQTTTANFVLNP